MSGEKLLWLGIGVALGWFVLPMVLGMLSGGMHQQKSAGQ